MDMRKQRRLTIFLSLIYLAGVTAVILFKFPFRGETLGSTRVVEFIPFYVSEIKDVDFFRINLIYNTLFFMPPGLFVCLLKPGWTVGKKLLPVVLLSLLYEALQFILGIGVSDITDLMTNTAGGLAGIGLFVLTQKIFKEKTGVIMNVGSVILVAGMLALFSLASIFMIR